MSDRYDVAVVGAGILGLAFAYHLANRGMKVVVLERHPRAAGASVRNFGLIWPIGQPPGPRRRLALRSREIWLELLSAMGVWHARTGSVHLAYSDDEAQVLEEYAQLDRGDERSIRLLPPAELLDRFSYLRPDGLRSGLWSPDEVTVDPRQVLQELPPWLRRRLGVEFAYGSPVLGWDGERIRTGEREWRARRMVICTGSDFQELAPRAFAECGLSRCKLQMLRTRPYGAELRLGTVLAAGLTLGHYASFAGCPSLPGLRRRLKREFPEHVRYGIHVLAAQNGLGELVLGDSHEYEEQIEVFDKPEIDALILGYLQTFLATSPLEIAARWHGIYVRHPSEPFVSRWLEEGVLAVTGLGGAGMTLSLGLAEQLCGEFRV